VNGGNAMTRKKNIQEIATVTEPVIIEEATSENSLRRNLEEIKTYDGVIGYILRNSTTAAIDLKDPAKIVDYAILSSSAFDASKELSELFELGNTKNMLVEGKDAKALSVVIGENEISVFMEKNADHKKVLKRLNIS
jgi:predicted regulator of Ras-like GTPase activity (Roadblock/LC7/MglB family)